MENAINEIVDNIEGVDALIQLMEECAELIQACTKLIRAYRGTTPVSIHDARAAFIEEMADVSVSQAVAMCGIMGPEETERMFAIESEKAQRWQERISKGVLNV